MQPLRCCCKIVKAILLVMQATIIPPGLSILTAAPKGMAWCHAIVVDFHLQACKLSSMTAIHRHTCLRCRT